jgi:hypothetical protein
MMVMVMIVVIVVVVVHAALPAVIRAGVLSTAFLISPCFNLI